MLLRIHIILGPVGFDVELGLGWLHVVLGLIDRIRIDGWGGRIRSKWQN